MAGPDYPGWGLGRGTSPGTRAATRPDSVVGEAERLQPVFHRRGAGSTIVSFAAKPRVRPPACPRSQVRRGPPITRVGGTLGRSGVKGRIRGGAG